MHSWINETRQAIISTRFIFLGFPILQGILVVALLRLSSRQNSESKSLSAAPGLGRIAYAVYYNLLGFVGNAVDTFLAFFPRSTTPLGYTSSNELPPYVPLAAIVSIILQARRLQNAGYSGWWVFVSFFWAFCC